MSSAAQVLANTANAQHSTGPTTEAGKAISSHNSLKHGLTAQTVLLPGEDEAAYRKLCSEMFEFYSPGCVPETQLVQNLCDTQWRINRCPRLEAAALSSEVPDFKAFDVISKHQARLQRIQSAILKDLGVLNAARRAHEQTRLEHAKLVRRADVLKGRPTDFKAIGFDFSVQEVDAAINREDALRRAHKVVSQQFVA